MPPKSSSLKPASKDIGPTYSPESTGMSHDPLFAALAPGVANSGTLANKWGAEGDHTRRQAPPEDLDGD